MSREGFDLDRQTCSIDGRSYVALHHGFRQSGHERLIRCAVRVNGP
jgi:hypothetical protein